jgi:hypothetical protein
MSAFQAWHATNKGDDSFWTKVGAAWPHRDGKGLSLCSNCLEMVAVGHCRDALLCPICREFCHTLQFQEGMSARAAPR